MATQIEDRAEIPIEQRFLLRGVDWETYQAVSEALSGRHVRLTYDGENLEFMTISPAHANYSRLLGRMIVVLTEELGLPLASFGDMTCQRDDVQRGLEPDECFYITHEPQVRGLDTIDLSSAPPPDLAIEVDISRSSRDRLSIYAALNVPEIWRFNGTDLYVYQLQSDDSYLVVEQSSHFPFLSMPELVVFLQRRTETDENSLIRAFREWVREQVSEGS